MSFNAYLAHLLFGSARNAVVPSNSAQWRLHFATFTLYRKTAWHFETKTALAQSVFCVTWSTIRPKHYRRFFANSRVFQSHSILSRVTATPQHRSVGTLRTCMVQWRQSSMLHDPQQWMESQGELYAPALLPRGKTQQTVCVLLECGRQVRWGRWEAAAFVLFMCVVRVSTEGQRGGQDMQHEQEGRWLHRSH